MSTRSYIYISGFLFYLQVFENIYLKEYFVLAAGVVRSCTPGSTAGGGVPPV